MKILIEHPITISYPHVETFDSIGPLYSLSYLLKTCNILYEFNREIENLVYVIVQQEIELDDCKSNSIYEFLSLLGSFVNYRLRIEPEFNLIFEEGVDSYVGS